MVWWKSTDVSEEHVAPFMKVEEQDKEETSMRRKRAWCFVDEENIPIRRMDLLHFVTVINYKTLLLLQS
jgi:hypothetical protein